MVSPGVFSCRYAKIARSDRFLSLNKPSTKIVYKKNVKSHPDLKVICMLSINRYDNFCLSFLLKDEIKKIAVVNVIYI